MKLPQAIVAVLKAVIFLLSNGCTPAMAEKDGRIVGGDPVPLNEYPSMAIPNVGSNTCGASLIHGDILVTAAHCQGEFNLKGVYIGGIQVSGADAVDNIPVVSIHPHPEYNDITMENDIMLVRLVSSSTVTPTALNFDPTIPVDGADVTAIGFGRTSEGGPSSDVLLKVTIPTVDFETCKAPYEADPSWGPGSIVDEVMLCAGLTGVGGKDGMSVVNGTIFMNLKTFVSSSSLLFSLPG
jgi:secreted trypsin-like serine protease